jgi:chlorite dismutase
MTTNPRLHTFVGGKTGPWQTISQRTLAGDALAAPLRLAIEAGEVAVAAAEATWVLRGVTSNERYVTRLEKAQLVAKQPELGRAEADCAVLIPIKKHPAWWAMTQDERRHVFEESSRHNRIGLEYLPAIARRLHHCRDLTTAEPFDFLTWFEFAGRDTGAFDQLLQRLRATPEWRFVAREVEFRFQRVAPG